MNTKKQQLEKSLQVVVEENRVFSIRGQEQTVISVKCLNLNILSVMDKEGEVLAESMWEEGKAGSFKCHVNLITPIPELEGTKEQLYCIDNGQFYINNYDSNKKEFSVSIQKPLIVL